jgi:hypothetical protein
MHDRKHESHQLARIAEQLRIENPGSKPSSEQCKSAQVDLDMATLNGISEEFTKSVRSLEELGAAVGLDIPSFHGFLKANVILASSTADRVLSSSRAPELAGSIQAIFSRIDSAVVRMAKAVTTAVPNGQLPIDDIQDVVTPYAYILYC